MHSSWELVNSIASNGCVISGKVVNSVLSPGVIVEKGAVVRDSVIMNDTIIKSGTVVDCCVLDKEIEIGEDARIGGGKDNTPISWNLTRYLPGSRSLENALASRPGYR